MAILKPFRGVLYDPARVGDLSEVLCPAFDSMTPELHQDLLRRSPYNAARLELIRPGATEPAPEAEYRKAGSLWRRWSADGLLRRDASPCFYLLDEYFHHEGSQLVRSSLLARVRLEDPRDGVIVPHEQTRPGPTADRLAVLKATDANISPIMVLYEDPDGAIRSLLEAAREAEHLAEEATMDGIRYRLWRLQSGDHIAHVMQDRRLFIADGHHRYQAACRYDNGQMPNAHAADRDYMMMGLIAIDDPALVVLPFHRLLSGMSAEESASLQTTMQDAFDGSSMLVSTDPRQAVEQIVAALAAAPAGRCDVVTIDIGGARVWSLVGTRSPAERSDTTVMHERVFGRCLALDRERSVISFTEDPVRAVTAVREGRSQMAVFLRPLPMEMFVQIAGSGEVLPSKSTCFYPKLPTGLVFNSLEI